MYGIDEYVKARSAAYFELKWLLRNKKKLIFFDIGSCTGEDSIKYRMEFPNTKVYAFEPLPSNIKVINEHLKQCNIDGVEIVPLALSDKKGQADFYVSSGKPDFISEEEGHSSMFPKEWQKKWPKYTHGLSSRNV